MQFQGSVQTFTCQIVGHFDKFLVRNLPNFRFDNALHRDIPMLRTTQLTDMSHNNISGMHDLTKHDEESIFEKSKYYVSPVTRQRITFITALLSPVQRPPAWVLMRSNFICSPSRSAWFEARPSLAARSITCKSWFNPIINWHLRNRP